MSDVEGNLNPTVAIVVAGRFFAFDIARALQARGRLAAIAMQLADEPARCEETSGAAAPAMQAWRTWNDFTHAVPQGCTQFDGAGPRT